MAMSPLCSRLPHFYIVSRPVRQKSPGMNPCISMGQSGSWHPPEEAPKELLPSWRPRMALEHLLEAFFRRVLEAQSLWNTWGDPADQPKRMSAFLPVSLNGYVATLQQFAKILYRLPPSASKIDLLV